MLSVRPVILRSACAYAQSDQSLCLSLEYSTIVKLLTEHHLEFLSLKGGLSLHLSKSGIVGKHMSLLRSFSLVYSSIFYVVGLLIFYCYFSICSRVSEEVLCFLDKHE